MSLGSPGDAANEVINIEHELVTLGASLKSETPNSISAYSDSTNVPARTGKPHEVATRLSVLLGDSNSDFALHLLELGMTQNVKEVPFTNSVKVTNETCLGIYIGANAPTSSLRKVSDLLSSPSLAMISVHIFLQSGKPWSEYTDADKGEYKLLLDSVAKTGKLRQCSLVNLPENGTDFQPPTWAGLDILDLTQSHLRTPLDLHLYDSVKVLNISGSKIESLGGFKLPPRLLSLDMSHCSLVSLDQVALPQSLRYLNISHNRIYFLNYVELPQGMIGLDMSHNRVESLRNANFPRNLKYLSISFNPVDCKGVRFPESLVYLDASCIPNETMLGIKLPDLCIQLNLQQSMTNTRGLKVGPNVREINMAGCGVNSINPLKLPNTIESMFLANNNIKTLSKVIFPASLRQIYLGNNLITTLKNVQFPPSLEVLDMDQDPDAEENEKHLTNLKEVMFPRNLRVLKLGYHLIRSVESMDFPYGLEELSLAYNDLRVFRNIRFGPHLRILDLSGNQELMSIDNIILPDSLKELRVPPILLNNMPASIVEKANKGELTLLKSKPFRF